MPSVARFARSLRGGGCQRIEELPVMWPASALDRSLAVSFYYPPTDIVPPQDHEPVRRHLRRNGSFGISRGLARRMGFAIDRRRTVRDMPTGSMFRARPAALRLLPEIKPGYDDFPIESGQTCGTLDRRMRKGRFQPTAADRREEDLS